MRRWALSSALFLGAVGLWQGIASLPGVDNLTLASPVETARALGDDSSLLLSNAWTTLEELKAQGKVRYYGIALGPAIGWLYEGINCIRERDITSVQHIYNMLEQHPGRAMHDATTDVGKDTMFLIRVTHSSGMLEGKYTEETKFPPTDHRSHRPRSWLLNGIKKIDKLRFLENSERTLGQAALQWLLADDRVASTLPNIYEEAQLIEFATAPDCPPLTSEDIARIDDLYADNFGLEPEEPKFKGTMELPKESAVAESA